jgi:hypothetical protein
MAPGATVASRKWLCRRLPLSGTVGIEPVGPAGVDRAALLSTPPTPHVLTIHECIHKLTLNLPRGPLLTFLARRFHVILANV